MALDTKTFRTRTLTAVLFAAVMLSGIFISAWLFIALFTIICVGCLAEFIRLIRLISPGDFWKHLPLGIFYVILPVLMMIDLGMQMHFVTTGFHKEVLQYYYPLLPAAVVFSIWINDTMAYIVGSLIGKTPFSKISPKKTWEGTAGGAVLCIVVITILGATLSVTNHLSFIHWVAIAFICAVFGTMGDLLESKLKRMAGVKDSGSFLPGHGGFLDRFDSLLIATPVVWFYVKNFVQAGIF